MTSDEVFIIFIVIIFIAILDGQITTDPENNMLLGNPVSILLGMYLSQVYHIHWAITIGTLLIINIVIYQYRIRF